MTSNSLRKRYRGVFFAIVLLTLLLGPLVMRVLADFTISSTVEATVTDTNHDGFEDLLFSITTVEGFGVEGVQVNLTFVEANETEPLLTGRTNGTGHCVFYSMPCGNYSWRTAEGTPTSGTLQVSLKQYPAFSEKEATTIQFLLLTWMVNGTEKTRTFYENFSRYVGLDLEEHSFPSPSGKNLAVFSRDLFIWYQRLESCILSNVSDAEVSQLLQKILGVSKEICAGTLLDAVQQNHLNNVTEIKLLIKGRDDNPEEIKYVTAFWNGNVLLRERNVLRISTSTNKTIAALLGVFVTSFDPFASFAPFNETDWKVGAESESLLVQVYFQLQMAESILDSFSSVLSFINRFISIQAISDFATVIDMSLVALGGYILGVWCFLELTHRYPSLGSWVDSLVGGDLAAISLTIGLATGFAIGLYFTYLLYVGAASSAVPVIGLAIAAITAIIGAILARSDYISWLEDLSGTLGGSLTKMFKMRDALYAVDANSIRHSAETHLEAADLLGKFLTASPHMSDFFNYSRNELWSFGTNEGSLAEAIEDTRNALDDLIVDYLYWEGGNGTVEAHLEGVYSTVANYTNTVSFVNTVGILYPSSGFLAKCIDNHNLDPSPVLKTQSYYEGWAYKPHAECDNEGNSFAVTYNNSTHDFSYNPQPPHFEEGNVMNVTRNGELEVFYQFKFFFDEATTRYGFPDLLNIVRWGLPVEPLLVEWQNHLEAKYESDLKPKIQHMLSLVELLTSDTEPPKTKLFVSNIPVSKWPYLIFGEIYMDSSTMLTLSASDAKSSVAVTAYRIYNGTFSTDWNLFSGQSANTLTFTFPMNLKNGEYHIEFNSTDLAGNTEQSQSSTTVFEFAGLELTISSPTFVLERAKLGVSPTDISVELREGDSVTTTLTVREMSGAADLRNVVLEGSNLTGGSGEMVIGDWDFSLSTPFDVLKGESLDVAATLQVPENEKSGIYYGIVEIKNRDGTQFVFFNITYTAALEINILSPENRTYTTSNVPLTFTIDQPTSWIGYSLDGQANVTITGNTTLNGLAEGIHSIIVYANDTLGNMWASPRVCFTVAFPLYELTVASSPITLVPFTINGAPETTPYNDLLREGSYTLVMPETYNGYIWSYWLEDGDTNRVKTITLPASTYTAVYVSPQVGGYSVSISPGLSLSWMATTLLLIFAFICSGLYVKRSKHCIPIQLA